MGLPRHVEIDVTAHLAGALADDPVPVVEKLPAKRPDRLVRLIRTDTRPLTLVTDEAQLTIECWAPTKAAAWDLGARVYAAMCAMDTDTTWVPRGQRGWVGGPAYLEDPLTATPRYVMTARVRSAKT